MPRRWRPGTLSFSTAIACLICLTLLVPVSHDPPDRPPDCRLNAEQAAFCEVLQTATGMADSDMEDFAHQYANDKAGQGRVLKAKFSVRTVYDSRPAPQG